MTKLAQWARNETRQVELGLGKKHIGGALNLLVSKEHGQVEMALLKLTYCTRGIRIKGCKLPTELGCLESNSFDVLAPQSQLEKFILSQVSINL